MVRYLFYTIGDLTYQSPLVLNPPLYRVQIIFKWLILFYFQDATLGQLYELNHSNTRVRHEAFILNRIFITHVKFEVVPQAINHFEIYVTNFFIMFSYYTCSSSTSYSRSPCHGSSHLSSGSGIGFISRAGMF